MDVPCIKKKHLFLTGEKRVGKSTLLQAMLAKQAGVAGGFYTRRTDVCSPGEYAVHLLQVRPDGGCEEPSAENRLFFCGQTPAETAKGDVQRVKRFEALGIAALKKAKEASVSVILMDELGPGEEEAAAFQEAVFQTLDGSIPVLGVLQRADSAFLDAIAARPDVELLEVTLQNRDALAEK